MGRSGTHPRAPPPAPKLQIFKLCRLAIIPQSQLLQAVGARVFPPPHHAMGQLPPTQHLLTTGLRQAPSKTTELSSRP